MVLGTILRFLGILGAAVALVVPSALAALSAPAWYARDDDMDDQWSIGVLTWSGGEGRIAWDDDSHGEDRGSVSSAVTEFKSDPLPRALHLNATRTLQLDLAVATSVTTASICTGKVAAGLEIQLFAGDELLAGATDGMEIQYQRPRKRPADPAGFTICRYRMPAEVANLEQGMILRLQIRTLETYGPYEFGTSAEHPSVLRVPFFSSEELLYRDPLLARSDPSRLEGPISGAGDLASFFGSLLPKVGLAAAGLFSIGGRRRPKGRRILVFAFVVMVPFAGCLGSGDPAGPLRPAAGSAGDAKTEFLDVGETGLANRGFGTIVGTVHDDLRIPISGAHLALLGTANHTQSDHRGRFSIRDIGPGEYRLRVDKAGYQPLEEWVRVLAENLTRIDITLALEGALETNARPHHHDYWTNDTRRVAFNGTVGKCTGTGCTGVFNFFLPESSSADHNVVLPGTYEVEVVLQFDPARIGHRRVGLRIGANDDVSRFNWSSFFPRASGEAFHMQSTWEMDDVGHQLFSTWVFGFYALGYDGVKPGPEAFVTSLLASEVPAFRVLIVLHKGVVPLEPAHPGHWKGAEQIVVDNGKKWSHPFYKDATGTVLQDVLDKGGCYNPSPVSIPFVLSGKDTAVFWYTAEWGPPVHVIPEGTTWIELNVSQNRPNGYRGTNQFGWKLGYKTGEHPLSGPGGTTSPYWQETTVVPRLLDGGKLFNWRIPVGPAEADGIYNKRSAWSFYVYPDDMFAACNDAHLNVAEKPLELTWTATAHRGVMPKG